LWALKEVFRPWLLATSRKPLSLLYGLLMRLYRYRHSSKKTRFAIPQLADRPVEEQGGQGQVNHAGRDRGTA
jgi:hypothetical protein